MEERMKYAVRVLLCLSSALGASAWAADRADLEGTSIIGSRELPKVTYIVPWKKPLPGDLVGRPVQSLLDEALAPVDRDVFRRQVEYHGLIEGRQKVLPPSGDLAHARQ
jgi:hypothetical protein